MREPVSTMRTSYHCPVWMDDETWLPTSDLRPAVICSMPSSVSFQPPMFHHVQLLSSCQLNKMRNPSLPETLRAFKLIVMLFQLVSPVVDRQSVMSAVC